MCDILLFQETWLYSSQFCLFTTYFNTYNSVIICGLDESVLHASRTVECDLRAKLLVACIVTPALWLNLSDSRNIFIIHFGLLLKERTLDSIGHDLWKKYNVICLLWMIRYISLLINIFTQWILIDFYHTFWTIIKGTYPRFNWT